MNGSVALALLGGLAALVASWRRGWLSPGGTWTAAVVGVVVLAGGGVAPCLLLVFFFVSSSWLTRFRVGLKPADGREHGSSSRDAAALRGSRTGAQVLANGGVVAALAVLSLVVELPWLAFALTGAIAAATADSWATEIGTGLRGSTRLITTLRPVEPGHSGGVSVAGTVAATAGAAVIGLLAAASAWLWPLSFPPAVEHGVGLPEGLPISALAGGLAGVTVDSWLGAGLEARCRLVTNETVNLACTFTGAWIGAWAGGAW